MSADDRRLALGFSPCPNDTFIFHGLVHGVTGDSRLDFGPPVLADVETLNEWALQGRLDVTKLSFHALGHVLDDYVLLRSGSALGRGCGPLLIAKKPYERQQLPLLNIAIPGRLTTAAMLLRLYEPGCKNLLPMRFDEIMPALANGVADAGVIIHESRFTYRQQGFVPIHDLGQWWEESSGLPIPLGGIAARRSLGAETIMLIEKGIRESIRSANQFPEKSKDYTRLHAQETDAQVIADHIALYVNDYSLDLGKDGLEAVSMFMARGREAGILPQNSARHPLVQV